MVSYKDSEIMLYDKKQTRLTVDGCKENDFIFAQDKKILKFNDLVTCPFCLYFDMLFKFKKVKYGLYKCPFCETEMRSTSLILDMDIEKFAKWVFDYRQQGFFQKLYPNFKEWNKRLWELGIAKEFWEKYKSLKGVTDSDEYEDE